MRQLPLRPAILGALLLGATSAGAGSAGATLTVGVTVVRSCAVLATSVEKGSARLDLTCAAGAASTVRQPVAIESSRAGWKEPLRLHVPTSPYRGTSGGDYEVATINF